MILLRIIFIVSILLVPVQIFAQAKALGEKQISFSVPEAPWNFILDAEGYTIEKDQIKPDGKYGYFLLTNDKTHVTFSLWIEPAINCNTSEECRDMVWRTGNPMWQNLENIVQSKIGDVYYFEFFRQKVMDQPVRMQDMYAEFVVDGYWIDLHISKPLYEKKDHAMFENLVNSAKFETKPKKAEAKIEKAPEAAQKALDAWIPLWDAGKYDEAYAELAADTRENITKRTWFVYWTGVRKPLGKLIKRELLKSEYIKSLQGAPDRQGAIFQYRSSFENKASVLETVSLMLEKDGTWRVANFLTD
jgi:hypothetical protein